MLTDAIAEISSGANCNIKFGHSSKEVNTTISITEFTPKLFIVIEDLSSNTQPNYFGIMYNKGDSVRRQMNVTSGEDYHVLGNVTFNSESILVQNNSTHEAFYYAILG